MINHFKEIFIKHINQLYDEVNAYANENDLWLMKPGIGNSSGNLALHLIGNLNHFIGAQLGKTGYVRNRELEFAAKNIRTEIILKEIEATKSMLEKTFSLLDDRILNDPYPLAVFGEGKTTHEILLILLTHFNYHLGQINYHRRLVKN